MRALRQIEWAAVFSMSLGSLASGAQVVALGASNTSGMGRGRTADGVPPSQAYPAQLQRILRAQGCRASVANAGVAGDTTAGMLARFPGSVGRETRVLVLQPGGNDRRRGSSDMTGAIMQAASARGIRVIVLDHLGQIAKSARLPDGQYFSAAGHAAFAAYLAPRVRSALGC